MRKYSLYSKIYTYLLKFVSNLDTRALLSRSALSQIFETLIACAKAESPSVRALPSNRPPEVRLLAVLAKYK